MKKIGFVVPWYGEKIPGGAEMETRQVIKHLTDAGIEIEVLTTCANGLASDWYKDYYKPQLYQEGKVNVRRFSVNKGNAEIFNRINAKLLRGMLITLEEEHFFLENSINSDELYNYMKKNKDEYSLFLFIPYMFGTTYYGIKFFPDKAVIIPCFHDECYVYFRTFKKCFSKVRGIVYNSEPEKQLANRLFNLKNVKQITMGIGVDTDIEGKPDRFRQKYGISNPYILYAGRKDETKNVHTLLKYFSMYKEECKSQLQLIMIGPGKILIPSNCEKDVHDLGFVPMQDKYDAYAASEILCQPSKNESFSFVIMESWLLGRPVMVHEECKVTTNFVKESNGGLYFRNYEEFAEELDYFLHNKKNAFVMGQQGKKYVHEHFSWEIIVERYKKFLSQCVE